MENQYHLLMEVNYENKWNGIKIMLIKSQKDTVALGSEREAWYLLANKGN